MKKLIIPGCALLIIIIVSLFLLSNTSKEITNKNEIALIKQNANLDILINLENFSENTYSEEKLLDVAMQYATSLNLLSEKNLSDTYLQYISKDELHNIILELTNLNIEAPIEIEDFYYLYDSENEYYYWVGYSPTYYKISNIKSIKRNGHNYTIECSIEKNEDGEKIVKDNVLIELELRNNNKIVKYLVKKLTIQP